MLILFSELNTCYFLVIVNIIIMNGIFKFKYPIIIIIKFEYYLFDAQIDNLNPSWPMRQPK